MLNSALCVLSATVDPRDPQSAPRVLSRFTSALGAADDTSQHWVHLMHHWGIECAQHFFLGPVGAGASGDPAFVVIADILCAHMRATMISADGSGFTFNVPDRMCVTVTPVVSAESATLEINLQFADADASRVLAAIAVLAEVDCDDRALIALEKATSLMRVHRLANLRMQ